MLHAPLKNVDLNRFRVYVSPHEYFMFQGSLPSFGNVDEINFADPKNVYCISLKAMYILSYLGGIGLRNLDSDNPLAQSLAHFYFYYHLQKFYNYREFEKYDTSPVESLPWRLYHWQSRFVWYHPQIKNYTPHELKRNDNQRFGVNNVNGEANKDTQLKRIEKVDTQQQNLQNLQVDNATHVSTNAQSSVTNGEIIVTSVFFAIVGRLVWVFLL